MHPWVAPLGSTLGKRPWVARLPITSNGDLIGLLLLVSRKGGVLRDPVVLATIAAQAAAALDHAALYEAAYQRERDLEGQDQRRREFMGALSHEIRTAVAAIAEHGPATQELHAAINRCQSLISRAAAIANGTGLRQDDIDSLFD